MIIPNNKALYVISLNDFGKFLIIDLLKNNPNVAVRSKLGPLKPIYKYILLVPQPSFTRVLDYIEETVPIFMFRDVRVSWLISEHKRGGHKRPYTLDQYIKKFNDLLETYLELYREQIVVVTKYEDFLLNKSVAYNRLCKDLKIQFNTSHIPSSFREKTTMISMSEIEKIVKFQKYVDDDQLSYISSKTKDYNKFLNYPYNLSKQDILRD